MKKFRVILKSGLYTDWEAENKEEILSKIKTGRYGILPVGGKTQIIISEENFDEIKELDEA